MSKRALWVVEVFDEDTFKIDPCQAMGVCRVTELDADDDPNDLPLTARVFAERADPGDER